MSSKTKHISTNERCEDLRNTLVEHIVKYFKNIAKWSDEQITTVDVDVFKSPNHIITCKVKIAELDIDHKYLLCNILTGILVMHGYRSEFQIHFPDTLMAQIPT